MSEQTPSSSPQPEADLIIEPDWLQKFVILHPRAARVIVIVGGLTTALSVGTVSNTMRKNRAHLDAAGEHLSLAASELSSAVFPVSDTPELL